MKKRADVDRCRTFEEYTRDRAPYEKSERFEGTAKIQKSVTGKNYRLILDLCEEEVCIEREKWQDVLNVPRDTFLARFELLSIPTWETFSEEICKEIDRFSETNGIRKDLGSKLIASSLWVEVTRVVCNHSIKLILFNLVSKTKPFKEA